MAIPTMSSQQYNEILEDAKNKITNLDDKVTNIKGDLQKKLQIMRYEVKYTQDQLSAIQSGAIAQDKKIKIFSRDGVGQFETYGSTIHPRFIKPPINVFNLNVSGTGEPFFRNDVGVTINNIAADEYKNILKHDSSSSKEIFFQTFKDRNIKLEVSIDAKNMLGDTKFNMIEIDSFLPGSYDITSIEVYNIDDKGQLETDPAMYLNINKAGKQRIIFENKVRFHKVVFNIKLNYSDIEGYNTVWPFGLKHIYFYDADFRTDSYVVATIKAEKPIAIVKDEVRIKTPFADLESETSKAIMAEENIHMFIDNINGELETEIYASTPSQRNEIARNITMVFVKIPVKKALVGIQIDIETR